MKDMIDFNVIGECCTCGEPIYLFDEFNRPYGDSAMQCAICIEIYLEKEYNQQEEIFDAKERNFNYA